MKLAFQRTNDLVSNLINAWTGFNGFGHVELVFSDGMSFSSVPGEGVRFAEIDYEAAGNNYVIIEFDPVILFGLRENQIRKNAKKIEGAKYDLKGIFLCEFLPFNIENPKEYYCSETFRKITRWKSYQVSPNKLYRQFIKKLLNAALNSATI